MYKDKQREGLGMIVSCGNCGKTPIYKWGLCKDCFNEYQELRQIVRENQEPDMPESTEKSDVQGQGKAERG